MTKTRILRILMERDGLTESEAMFTLHDVEQQIDMVLENGGSVVDVEEIIADELGLEPDYLETFL